MGGGVRELLVMTISFGVAGLLLSLILRVVRKRPRLSPWPILLMAALGAALAAVRTAQAV